MPKVSVIVAIYNIEGYLDRCLNSLKEQTFKDFEVLCVDDGSKDGSGKIIDSYVEEDKRFRHLLKENGGLSDARNYGMQHMSGDYIVFIDGDDFVEKDLLETVYDRMASDDLDLCVYDYYQNFILTGNREVIHIPFNEDKVYSLKNDKELLCFVSNCAWNKMYRKELFLTNGILYPKGYIQEDLGTTPKILYLADRIGFVNRPLYIYIVDRPNNITTERSERIYLILDMCSSFIGFYKEKGAFETYYEECKYLASVNIMQSLKKLPYFTDKRFVDGFLNAAFAFLKKNFPDFPKCRYDLYSYKEDHIYLNKTLLRTYLAYKRLTK